jgi:hypothetical protein
MWRQGPTDPHTTPPHTRTASDTWYRAVMIEIEMILLMKFYAQLERTLVRCEDLEDQVRSLQVSKPSLSFSQHDSITIMQHQLHQIQSQTSLNASMDDVYETVRRQQRQQRRHRLADPEPVTSRDDELDDVRDSVHIVSFFLTYLCICVVAG